jgi:hypothetical protein
VEDLKGADRLTATQHSALELFFFIYVLVVKPLTVSFIVQWGKKERKKDKLVLVIHKAMTAVENEICQSLIGGQSLVWNNLWIIREKGLLYDNQLLVKKSKNNKSEQRKTPFWVNVLTKRFSISPQWDLAQLCCYTGTQMNLKQV